MKFWKLMTFLCTVVNSIGTTVCMYILLPNLFTVDDRGSHSIVTIGILLGTISVCIWACMYTYEQYLKCK